MVKVLPEIALLYFGLEVLVCSSQDTDVHCDILVTAHSGEFLFLKHTEHFGLGGKAHVPYFIQKQSASVSLFELALMLLDGGSECPLLMPEKFAFYQFGRDSRTVHFDIRHRGPVAFLMKASGYKFLSRTVGTDYQHPRIGRSHLLYNGTDMLHRFGLAYHLLAVDLFLQNLRFLHKGYLVRGILDCDEYAVQIQRFLDKVESAFLYAFHRRVYVPVTGNHHHSRVYTRFVEPGKHLYTIHVGHLDIAENHAVPLFFRHFAACSTVFRHIHFISFIHQDLFQ